MNKLTLGLMLLSIGIVLMIGTEISNQNNYIEQIEQENEALMDKVLQLDTNKQQMQDDIQSQMELIDALKQNKIEYHQEREILNERIKELNDEVNKLKGSTMIVEATAYTAYCKGCSGVTYTGQNLRKNPDLKVIAVDPNIIPLGSVVWVEGYGKAIAGDIGGAIKGKRIDIFIPNRSEALDFGRQEVKVRILS